MRTLDELAKICTFIIKEPVFYRQNSKEVLFLSLSKRVRQRKQTEKSLFALTLEYRIIREMILKADFVLLIKLGFDDCDVLAWHNDDFKRSKYNINDCNPEKLSPNVHFDFSDEEKLEYYMSYFS